MKHIHMNNGNKPCCLAHTHKHAEGWARCLSRVGGHLHVQDGVRQYDQCCGERGQLKANGMWCPAVGSNLLQPSVLPLLVRKHSHSNRNKHLKRSCVCVCHELLTSRFAEPWGKSPGIPQFTGASRPQSNPQWLKRFVELSAVKILWHASHGRINDSVTPNLGLIDAVLHLEKVACQCRKINSLFAEGLFHPNHFSLAFLTCLFKQHFQSGSLCRATSEQIYNCCTENY